MYKRFPEPVAAPAQGAVISLWVKTAPKVNIGLRVVDEAGCIGEIGILAEAGQGQPVEGQIAFDDVRLIIQAGAGAVLPPLSANDRAERSFLRPPKRGVAVHFTGGNYALDLARDAGFAFVRTDLGWAWIEKNGRYDFSAYRRTQAPGGHRPCAGWRRRARIEAAGDAGTGRAGVPFRYAGQGQAAARPRCNRCRTS